MKISRSCTPSAWRAAGILLFSMILTITPEISRAQTQLGPITNIGVTGDWGGRRTKLADRGIRFGLIYTADYMANFAGGLRRNGAYLDNIYVKLTFDLHAMRGWSGAKIFLYGIGNNGGNPSANTGDIQGISNIAAFNTWKLYEAWFEQDLFGNRLSILLGLMDVNAGFDILPSAGLFLNSSFGMGPDFSQSGRNGPSIFPATSLGMRIEGKPTYDSYIQMAFLDGVPGDPANPRGTRIRFDESDGFLLATEGGYLVGVENSNAILPKGRRPRRRRIGRVEKTGVYESKLAIGAWWYTSRFSDLNRIDATGNPRLTRRNAGAYLLGEHAVYRDPDDPNQKLTIFARVGFANASVNRFKAYTGGGLVYHGLIPRRLEDEVGLAIAAGHNGTPFRQMQNNAGQSVERAEITIEGSYLAPINSWLAIQPDIQYVINPNTKPEVRNAWVGGIRWEATF